MRNTIYAAAIATLLSGCTYIDAFLGPTTSKKYDSIEQITQCPEDYEGRHVTVQGIPAVCGMSLKTNGYLEVDITITSLESNARLVAQEPMQHVQAMDMKKFFYPPRRFEAQGDMRQGKLQLERIGRGHDTYQFK